MTTESKAAGKSKTTAVVMALFLSFWSWLYTYQKDARKFWLGAIVIAIDIVAYVIVLTVAGNAPIESTLSSVYKAVTIIGLIIIVAVWVWAFLDAVIKTDEWYRAY